MKYDSLFNVLYSDKEDVVSYNKLTAKPVQKYVYFASKENYKSLNNEYLHEEFNISPNPGQASCKLVSLEDINKHFFSHENFIFDKTIGYKEWNNSSDKLKKPLKNVTVFVKSSNDFNSFMNRYSTEGYIYCIDVDEFNSSKENISYVKKYKIRVNYSIKKE